MAINFNNYLPGGNTATKTNVKTPTKSRIDFSKYSSGDFVPTTSKPSNKNNPVVKLSSGGALNIGTNTNELVNTGHTTYGGVPTKKGFERADIVPVSLGGSNSSPENITYEPYSTVEKLKDRFSEMLGKNYVPKTATDKYLVKEVLPAYKSGKITLNEARVKAISYLDNQQKGIKQGVAANLPSAIKETVGGFLKGLVEPFVEYGTSVVNVGRQTGAVVKAIKNGDKTVPDYLSKSYSIPIYGQANPMFTGNENTKQATQKIIGNALEIAPYFIGVPEAKGLLKTIDTIGAKSVGSISAKEALTFAKAYGTKVAASSLGLGTMFGLGGSIKEGAGVKETAGNVAKSIATVALLELTLSPLISYGLKNVKGRTVKESVDKVLEDHKNVIDFKAQEIKSKALPAPEEPKLLPNPGEATGPITGKGFILSDKPNEEALVFTRKENVYKKAVEDFTQKPGVKSLEKVLKAKEERVPVPFRIQETAVVEPTKSGIDFSKYTEQPKTETIAQETQPTLTTKLENTAQPKIVSDTVTGSKVSGVAKSIEAKSIEQNLTKGFKDVAGYDPITIKDQAKRAADLMNKDIELAKKMVKGEAPVEAGLKPEALIKAMEDYAQTSKDVQLLTDIVKSPLVSETSLLGQGLRLLAERNPDSAVANIKKVVDSRKTNLGEDVKKEMKKIKEEVKKEIKKTKPTKDVWLSFIDEIKC